jgi:hypothetical protein
MRATFEQRSIPIAIWRRLPPLTARTRLRPRGPVGRVAARFSGASTAEPRVHGQAGDWEQLTLTIIVWTVAMTSSLPVAPMHSDMGGSASNRW